MSCHDYEGVMLVLCTPLQVKCHPFLFSFLGLESVSNLPFLSTLFSEQIQPWGCSAMESW